MTITSTNYMLEGMPAHRGGFDGLKTGTQTKLVNLLVGTTVEKGMRVYYSRFECRPSRQ